MSTSPTQAKRPNVVYFLVDNLGMGELSSYSGGPLRGVATTRLDNFAKEGMLLLNFAPEAQCSPSRAALMTGRYSIRSGNHTVELAGSAGRTRPMGANARRHIFGCRIRNRNRRQVAHRRFSGPLADGSRIRRVVWDTEIL
jgi:sulfatase-like protein